MIRRIVKTTALLGAVGALAFGSVTLAQGGSAHKASSESSAESTAPENSATDSDNVQYTAPGDADHQGAKAARHGRGHHSGKGSRHHSHRAGDPSEPNETAGEQESSVEAEQGQPGEPANGHADQPGQDVNHECTGDCVE